MWRGRVEILLRFRCPTVSLLAIYGKSCTNNTPVCIAANVGVPNYVTRGHLVVTDLDAFVDCVWSLTSSHGYLLLGSLTSPPTWCIIRALNGRYQLPNFGWRRWARYLTTSHCPNQLLSKASTVCLASQSVTSSSQVMIQPVESTLRQTLWFPPLLVSPSLRF